MISLNSVKWGKKSFDELFVIKSGVRLTKDDMIEGDRPFIGATDSNNGITAFCRNTNKSLDSNCLGINYNGSVVENFYHPYEAIFSDDVKHLHLRGHEGNKYIYLFFKNLILMQKNKYQYGYKFNEDRMLKQKLIVPVNSNNEPDYDFMEQYMKEIERKQLIRYKSYLAQMKHKTLNDKILNNESDVKWNLYVVGDLFNVKRPKARNKDDYQSGDRFFVASGAFNNGVMKCCTPKIGETLDVGNCLTVSPVDGTCFYQPVDFLGRGGAGSSIILLYHKKITLNKYTGLFISKALNKVTSIYCYGRMANADSIKKTLIYLPEKHSGLLNYAYMEAYMKNKETEIINRYVTYRLSKL